VPPGGGTVAAALGAAPGQGRGIHLRRLVNQCVRGQARARVTSHACLPTP